MSVVGVEKGELGRAWPVTSIDVAALELVEDTYSEIREADVVVIQGQPVEEIIAASQALAKRVREQMREPLETGRIQVAYATVLPMERIALDSARNLQKPSQRLYH